MAEVVKKQVPAYVSFTTMRNFFDLIRTQGVPPVIDASMFKNMSGSSSSQLRTALKYLGLTDEDGATDSKLESIVYASDEERPTVLAEILKSAYPFLFGNDFDIEKGTFRQFDDKFREEGATGATVVKAERFFLQAAEYAQIPVSTYIIKGMKARRTPRKAPKTRTPVVDKETESEKPKNTKPPAQQQNGVQQQNTPVFNSIQYPILSAYFSQLPEDGVWEMEEKKSQWLDGVKMALSFETRVIEDDYEDDDYYE